MSITLGSRSEQNKKGEITLFARYKFNGDDKKIYTGIKISSKHWDSKNKRIKPKHPNYELKSKQLTDLKIIIEDLNSKVNISPITFQEVKNRITGGSEINDVESFVKTYLNDDLKESTFTDYISKINSIKSNLGIRKMTFNEMCYKAHWDNLKKSLKKNGRSPVTFNSYYKTAKAIHSHAYKREKTFSNFPYIKQNTEPNFENKWLSKNDLFDVIKSLDPNDEKIKENIISIFIYLLMFSLRGMYRKDIESLKMENFQNAVYQNGQFDLGVPNTVYKHIRSKTRKVGYIYMCTYPLYEIIISLNLLTSNSSDNLFPVFGGNIPKNFWDYYSKRFVALTGHNFKSSRKAFNTIGSVLDIPAADIRELLFQNDLSITKHYLQTQSQEMIIKYTKLHIKILEYYEVETMFEKLTDKLVEVGYKEFNDLRSIRSKQTSITPSSNKIKTIKKVRLKNGS